ncbi:MAG: hypothetical protein MJ070_10285 [Lachnospiraceae bacterium]|nr:hypothetical protein [Lachnospiraceae bacterium]
MKKLKALMALLFAVIFIIGSCLPVSALDFIGEKEDTTGALWWKQYHLYKAYYLRTNGYVDHYNKLSRTIKHTYRYRQVDYLDYSLSVTEEYSVSFNSTKEWNEDMGFSLGLPDIIELTANKGYGRSWGLTFSISRSSTYVKNIYNWFPTGTYFLAPGADVNVCVEEHWLKNSEGVYINMQEPLKTYYMPLSDGYVSAYYTTSSTSPVYGAP